MHRLSRRDPDALGLIFDLHASAMYGVLLHITGDRDVSDDLLQEAFLKVWTRASQFDAGKGRLRMWLISVVRNLALDYFRSAGYLLSRHRSVDILLERIPLIDEESRFYRSHWIAAGLCSLPPHEKRVLELAYFLGYSHAEIAPLMHIPLGTVKTWTRSALMRLREEFSPDLSGKAQSSDALLSLDAALVAHNQRGPTKDLQRGPTTCRRASSDEATALFEKV